MLKMASMMFLSNHVNGFLVDSPDGKLREQVGDCKDVLRSSNVRPFDSETLQSGKQIQESSWIHQRTRPSSNIEIISFTLFVPIDFFHVRLPIDFGVGNLYDDYVAKQTFSDEQTGQIQRIKA